MKRLRLAAFIGLLAGAIAGPLSAADLPRKAPSYAPSYVRAYDWTGFYVGLNGGYGWGTSTWSNAALTDSFAVKGGLVGGTLGYNLQTGAWVWGVEGDVDASWIKGSDNAAGGICGAAGCQTSNTWLGTARGRIGSAVGRFMPYLTGGAAGGNVKMTPATGGSATKTKLGWTVGSGFEYAFQEGWSGKIEYLYVDLGKGTCGAATCGIDTDVAFKASIVRVGVNYRF
jgi:outer membrane immunogenic protein